MSYRISCPEPRFRSAPGASAHDRASLTQTDYRADSVARELKKKKEKEREDTDLYLH